MLGCIQPMSSPMMNKMLGLPAGPCASAGAATSVIAANDANRDSQILRAILMLHILALERVPTSDWITQTNLVNVAEYDTRMMIPFGSLNVSILITPSRSISAALHRVAANSCFREYFSARRAPYILRQASALGQSQTLSRVPARSIDPSTSDMRRLNWHVGFVPKAELAAMEETDPAGMSWLACGGQKRQLKPAPERLVGRAPA